MFCLLASPCLSSREYVCCVCDPSVCLGGPSICEICMFVEFISEIEGSHVSFALMLFMCFFMAYAFWK